VAAKGNAVLFEDCNGYIPLVGDLTYLGLSNQDLQDCHYQQRPLGMTPDQFDDFKRSLKQALIDDELDYRRCDIRLKGSSASFYSGWHKLMPYHREVLRDAFNSTHKQQATPTDLTSIEAEIMQRWPNKYLRPVRRPFDSMARTGISPNLRGYLSDYDVQVSSAEIEKRVTDEAGKLNMPVILKPEYGFFNEEIVEEFCPHLAEVWPAEQRRKLGRNVAVKTFSDRGPSNETAKIGNLSSHFRDPPGVGNDWRLL
jgi:hypothetical protein